MISFAEGSGIRSFDATLPDPSWWSLAPSWQADPNQPISHTHLAASWQLLLLGDGFATRNLQLLVGEPITAHVLESVAVDPSEGDLPPEASVLDSPLIRRQVWLSAASDPTPLLYAASWWSAERMQRVLPDPGLPIGQSLAGEKREVFRELRSLHLGHSQPLANLFQQPEPFWGRQYLLWHQQQPLTLIYEVFSPILEKYLGSASQLSH